MVFQHDSGRAWAILIASCLSTLLGSISVYTMGITHMALMDKFQESRTKTAGVVSLFSSLICMAGPIAGLIINKTNCRTCHMIGGLMVFAGQVMSFFMESLDGLLVTYGFIGGIGASLSFNAAIIVVGYNFDRHRTLASGLAMAGCGLAMFCGPPIIRGFLDEYGVSGMLLLQGGMNAHLCALSLVMRPTPYEIRKSRTVDINTDSYVSLCKMNIVSAYHEGKALFSNLAFTLFAVVAFTWFLAIGTLLVYEPSIAVAFEVASPQQSALLITIFGSFNTVARYVVAFSTGKSALDPMVIYMGQTAIAGVTTILFPLFYNTYTGHVVFCAVVGFYTGGLNSQYSPITFDLVGVEHFASGFGIVLSFGGLGYLVGPPFVGYILDSGGTYVQVYIILGLIFLAGTLCTLICGCLEKRYAPNTVEKGETLLDTEPQSTEDISPDMHGSSDHLKAFKDTSVSFSLTNLYHRSLQQLAHQKAHSVSTPHLAI